MTLDLISHCAIAKFGGVFLVNHTDVWACQYQNVRQEGAARIRSEEERTESATSDESAAEPLIKETTSVSRGVVRTRGAKLLSCYCTRTRVLNSYLTLLPSFDYLLGHSLVPLDEKTQYGIVTPSDPW
jgi:hypothetical protein